MIRTLASLCLSVAFLPSGYAASMVEYCKPYTSVSQLAVDLKKPFIQYALAIEEGSGGRKIITITGDELLLNRETLGVIVRSAASADRTIESIRLHGRVVRFSGAIPMIEGAIEALANEIIFEDGASLSLLPNAGSGITLAAPSITLAESGFQHFDVRARQLPGKRDDFSDLGNVLTIAAERIVVGGVAVPDDQVRGTLARRFSRYPLTDFASKIDLATGAAGHQRWAALHKGKTPTWPQYSLATLRAAFRVAPFDDCTKEDITAAIKALLPVLNEVAGADITFEAQTILDSINGGVDLEGNGPAFASNRPLGDLLSEINGYAPGGGKLATLDFYTNMLENSVAGTPIDAALQTAQIGQLTENVRRATVDYQNTDNELVALQSSIGATLSLLADQHAAYKVRETRLKDHERDLKKGAQDRAQLISALSTTAAIAVTAYTGSPQTGSAVGGVIYAVGESGEGKPPFASLSAGIQFANAIQVPLSSMSTTVSELKASRGNYAKFIESFTLSNVTIKSDIDVPVKNPKPGEPGTTKLTRDAALKDLKDKGKALKDGVGALQKVYNDFTPKPSPISAVLEDDDSLKDLAQRIAATLEDAKKLTVALDAVQRRVQEQSVALVSNAERLSRLTNLPVANEARRKVYGQLAIEGARDEIAQFGTLVDQIRRLSIVEFRAPLPVDPVQVQNTFVAEQIDKGFDQSTVISNRDVGKVYVDQLNARKLQVNFLAGFIARASERQFRQYVQDRGNAPSVVMATEEITDSVGSPPGNRRFMRQLNELIDEQFHALGNPSKLQYLYARQLELPLNVREKLDQRFPARLLQVVITDLRPKYNLGGGDLVFRVEVDRVGNLRRAALADPAEVRKTNIEDRTCASKTQNRAAPDCFSVDLRPKTTPPESNYLPFEYTVGTILSGGAFRPTPPPSFWYIKSGDTLPSTGRTMMVSYSPAEARMFLKVRLDPRTNWANAPVFNRLTVSAEVFQ